MKQNFYVFLDIDGVLWDWNYIKSNNIQNFGTIKSFNPESVYALNFLMNKLKENFNPILVVSSTWRNDMFATIKVLKENGVELNLKTLSKTPISSNPELRGLEILKYLDVQENKENFVIIDDEMFDYKSHFNENRIIKTDIFKAGLNIKQVKTFLSNNKIIFQENNQ